MANFDSALERYSGEKIFITLLFKGIINPNDGEKKIHKIRSEFSTQLRRFFSRLPKPQQAEIKKKFSCMIEGKENITFVSEEMGYGCDVEIQTFSYPDFLRWQFIDSPNGKRLQKILKALQKPRENPKYRAITKSPKKITFSVVESENGIKNVKVIPKTWNGKPMRKNELMVFLEVALYLNDFNEDE